MGNATSLGDIIVLDFITVNLKIFKNNCYINETDSASREMNG